MKERIFALFRRMFVSETKTEDSKGGTHKKGSFISAFILADYFKLIALVLLLIPQVHHTFEMYTLNSKSQWNEEDDWRAWCFAIGVDMAILVFTVYGNIWIAVMFGVSTLACNFIYEFVPVGNLAKSYLGIILTLCLFSFSHTFLFNKKAKEKVAKFIIDIGNYFAPALNEQVPIKLHPHICPECGESFQSEKQLNAHITGHKKAHEWGDHGDEWPLKNKQREQWCIERYGGLEIKPDKKTQSTAA